LVRYQPRSLPGWLQGVVLLVFISTCFQQPYDLNGNIVKKTLPNSDTESETFDALNRSVTQGATTGWPDPKKMDMTEA